MPPLSNKTVAFFFVKVIAIYALLMVPWPGLRTAYARLYSAAGNIAFRTFGETGRVYFSLIDPMPGRNDVKDISVRLENTKIRGGGTMEMNSRLMGYLPTAFAVALILATPVPWRRRAGALVGGVVLMSAFAGLELSLRLLDTFSDNNPLAVFSLSKTAKLGLALVLKVIAMSPVTAYIAPVFAWIIVTFRREDWKTLLATRESDAKGGVLRVGG